MAIDSHPGEPHDAALAGRLNWLRAGVLGANDGIVSTAGLVIGVAGATTSIGSIATAGVAGLVAGAVSMALGEYVSVSSQRDTEKALLEKERGELAEFPEQEFEELVALYEAKGLSEATARQVARELTDRDAFAAHADVELRLDPDELTSPWQAAVASAVAFTTGSLLPLAAILLPPPSARIVVAFLVVVAALAGTGYLSARLGGARPRRAVLRLVLGGAAGMAVTYGIGTLIGGGVG
ncbi:VIT1/CCC1 transporter family protein [Actinoplanes flavus]|uniref:VIT family protein n=1 Tax=Actinoplanes flavus TaxID=2820290 RepID=A0ABS3UPJ4_9ACTN|nr:VIT family protein [Actinoplanes flavus]MBO3740161.1 VIT family protein [Actinoplanes flavus]